MNRPTETHTIDASGRAIGRVASEVAHILQGKHRPDYTPHIDSSDVVVVLHAGQVKLDAKKAAETFHIRHSGHPGGFRKVSLSRVKEMDPTQLISHAVYSMLPQNKLRTNRMKRLKFDSSV
ncbi:50S ribosomal protein L13 [Candidatus Uhrbacteria bacterium]|nr:50S ribosomal protein L13 [Candidatus Uhrbacteria bacterium]